MEKIKPYKIILPIGIGLAVVVFLFYKEFDFGALQQIHLTWASLFWLLMAFACVVIKNTAFIIRLRYLSGCRLSWRQAFRVILLWEFTSTVTPVATGGASVALIFIHKEGLSLGRSTTISMLSSILDEMYFIVLFPLAMLIFGKDLLFGIPSSVTWISSGLLGIVLLGYCCKLAWVALLFYGIFINSRGFGHLVYRISHLPFLKRWKRKAAKIAGEIDKTSKEIHIENSKFWSTAILTTLCSWTARFLVVNCLFLAFFPVKEHCLLVARQCILFLSLFFTPTPGGSGFAEIVFNEYLAGFISVAGLSVVLAFLWRLITYYPELIAGIIIFPKWIHDKFSH